MRRKYGLITMAIVISSMTLLMPHVALAQSSAISSGLNWITSVQAPAGNWGSDVTATDSVQATSAVLESLASINETTNQNYVNAVTWLSAQQLDTTRYVSDRLRIYTNASSDKDLILSYIDELSRVWG